MTRRKYMLLILMIGLFGYVAYECGATMTRSRVTASKARKNLRQCREYARKIRDARSHPQVTDGSAKDVGGNIRLYAEEAARSAGIAAASLKSVRHESSRRLGESAYKEKPVRIRLLKITPRQFVKFTHSLSTQHKLNPGAITMRAANRKSADNLWNIDVIFTYLEYEPSPTAR